MQQTNFHPAATLPSPASISWVDSILAQADRQPAATAVISGGTSMTYQSLIDLADRITATLIANPPANGFVGVALRRSVELPATLIGILRAGLAYIPVDPDYPAARIAQMVASAGIQHIITHEAHRHSFPTVQVTTLGNLPAATESPDAPIPLTSPIYAIFTSGSTGTPKAAAVLHQGFANLLDWHINTLTLTPQDNTLVISSPSFDLTQKNLFAPLVTGGRLIFDDGSNYDIHRISNLIHTHRVTVVNCTPSAFIPLIDASAANTYAPLASLRHVMLGGEPIPLPRVRTWLEHPSCQADIINSYGPTECADVCLFHSIHRGNLDAYPIIPLGREVPNTQSVILGDSLEILPDGEVGELCISGKGVGAGYLNDPARTADRFITLENKPLYRSGDLARKLPDGTFEFRGRADHQIKVNGFRIELGEIETALSRHPDVRDAVVLASDGRLIAHIRGTTTAESLLAFLAPSLPAYMLPNTFRFHEALPLTPNGKVDRLVLANPPQTPSPAPAPTSPDTLESSILTLWSEILGQPVTDPTANFFDLGGTSIHLAVIHVRLREKTGKDLAITDLFANPSARSLARFISPTSTTSSAPAIHERAQLQKAGMNRFRRPSPR
jgi:amino acid adenylation domain-containing protein